MDEPYTIHIPSYEGPLDLLLDLIRKHQINIYDIPIAKITRQYLNYIQVMQGLDISLAGEFLFMASTLIYIKSRMLLPVDPLRSQEEAEDPRAELVQRLLEHEKYKNAASMLYQKELVELSTWTLAGMKDFQDVSTEPGLAVNTFDLISNFHKILERAKAIRLLEIEREEMTIGQIITHLKQVFENSTGIISLDELFVACRSRQSVVVAFLVILEMAYLQAIVLFQKELFGEILAKRQVRFAEIMINLDDWTGRVKIG